MSELKLPAYRVNERLATNLVAFGLYGGGLRAWSLVSGHLAIGSVLVASLLLALALVVLGGFRRQVSLRLNPKMAESQLYFYGKKVSVRRDDLSRGAWVRARNAGSHFTEVLVEVGTYGYQTTTLVKLSYRLGKGVPAAEECAQSVSSFLGVPNKGYKGRA